MESIREEEIANFIHTQNSLRDFFIMQNKNVDHLPFLKREDIDINKWRMFKTLDGCGPEYIAIMKCIMEFQKVEDDDNIMRTDEDHVLNNNIVTNPIETEEFFEKITSMLPKSTDCLKHSANSSSFNQASDVGKQHQQAKKENNDDSSCMIEGLDEAQVPGYMNMVESILKLICNYEKKQRISFHPKTLLNGFKIII
jgi:hypothetical protein